MPELLGRINPDADLSPTVLGVEHLSDVERALANNAAIRGVTQVIKDLKDSETGVSAGSHLVEFEDGRKVAVPFSVSLANTGQEE